MNSGKDKEVVVSGETPVLGKVKGLFQLLTELQILSEGEKKAGDYNPELVVPYTTRMAFSLEGIHIAFFGILFTYFTLPLVIGAVNQYFPAFGKYEHSLFEKLILYCLSFSIGVTKIIFMSFVISRLYLGRATRVVVDWLVTSLIAFIIAFGIIGFFLYLVVYGYVLTDRNLVGLYHFLREKFSNATFAFQTYRVLYSIKLSLIPAAFYFMGYILLESGLIGIAYLIAYLRTKRRKAIMKKYGIEMESP